MASRSKKPVEGTLIRVHYDAGWGNRITVRGSKAPLSWTRGRRRPPGPTGNVWTYVVADSVGRPGVQAAG